MVMTFLHISLGWSRCRSNRLSCERRDVSEAGSARVSECKADLHRVLTGLGRGMSRALTDAEEDRVEDVVGELEEMWAKWVIDGRPAAESSIFEGELARTWNGLWRLDFTSSSTTRFAKGFSGIHAFVPKGRSEELTQQIDLDFMELRMKEVVSFLGGSRLEVRARGSLSRKTQRMFTWDPETWEFGVMKNAASGNRTIRSFCVGEVTFLDSDLRIDRGTTDQLYIWSRINPEA
uniref:Plastid lipid-associated protein/fibrillin conserved domain-containing protein n=1 Tax=Compsopogon caeruleus TaxID=31354 RepID=A0A7S1THC9_9RHOD